VGKVKDGTGLLEVTNRNFQEVARSAHKVAELVGEISAASREQALGIEQVSKAVAEMDKIVQQNAASAEEAAAAAEEMSSQAEVLKEVVTDLTTVIGGKRAHITLTHPSEGEKQALDWVK